MFVTCNMLYSLCIFNVWKTFRKVSMTYLNVTPLWLKWLLFSDCTTLQLIVPIIHGLQQRSLPWGLLFFCLSKLEVKREWIKTPTHEMSYRFDFDLSSNCKVKKLFHICHVDCWRLCQRSIWVLMTINGN